MEFMSNGNSCHLIWDSSTVILDDLESIKLIFGNKRKVSRHHVHDIVEGFESGKLVLRQPNHVENNDLENVNDDISNHENICNDFELNHEQNGECNSDRKQVMYILKLDQETILQIQKCRNLNSDHYIHNMDFIF